MTTPRKPLKIHWRDRGTRLTECNRMTGKLAPTPDAVTCGTCREALLARAAKQSHS